jgi:hypothetical protein
LSFLPGLESSDLVHAGLGGGIDGKFHHSDTGRLELEGNTPSVDHLGEEQPDGRRYVEPYLANQRKAWRRTESAKRSV